MQSLELRSDEKVHTAAKIKFDKRMLALTFRELAAVKAHYHKTCYRNYTRDDKLYVHSGNDTSDEPSTYQQAEHKSFLQLFSFIRHRRIWGGGGRRHWGHAPPPPPRSYAGAPKWQNNWVLFSYLTFSIYQIAATTSFMSSNEHNSACSLCMRK